VAVLELDPDWSPEGVRLLLDGEDVTDRCQIRTDRAHPPRRAEIVLAGLPPGAQQAHLSWRGSEASFQISGG